MAVDLRYVHIECDHSIKDHILFNKIEKYETILYDGSYYGISRFGDSYYGPNYTGVNFEYPASINSDGTYTITFKLPIPISEEPKLFIDGDYNRILVPKFKTDSLVQTLRWGTDLQYSDELLQKYAEELMNTSDREFAWEVDYKNQSITIYTFNPLYTWILDYKTPKEFCPYCEKESFTRNDIQIANTGELSLIFGSAKLAQTVMKSILTEKGKNKDYPLYGTYIFDIVSSNSYTKPLDIRTEILEQLEAIIENQKDIISVDPTFYTSDEILRKVLNIEITKDANDPISILINVILLTYIGERIEANIKTNGGI